MIDGCTGCVCVCLCVSRRRAISDFDNERIQTRLCGRGGVVCARSDACRDHEEVYASVCSVVQRAARNRKALSTWLLLFLPRGGQRAENQRSEIGGRCRVCACACACVFAFAGVQVTVSLARASVLASPRPPTSKAVTPRRRAPPSPRTRPVSAPMRPLDRHRGWGGHREGVFPWVFYAQN